MSHLCGLSLYTQIVKEYERAIIFRLGRILRGGAKGPGQKCFYTQAYVFYSLSILSLFIKMYYKHGSSVSDLWIILQSSSSHVVLTLVYKPSCYIR